MPRRKRAFIQRANAHTYHVIRQPTSENPDHHVLVSDPSSSSTTNFTNSKADDELEKAYSSRDYELGEFGFPDDGYDYSKHFRLIGGGGGVFMSAATGLPDPDAVRQIIYKNKPQQATKPSSSKDVVVIKDNDTTNDQSENEDENQLESNDEQASLLRQNALYEIQKDRKYNEDLDQVLVELDGEELFTENETDVETDTQLSDEEQHNVDDLFGQNSNDNQDQNASSDDVEPDDYFGKLLNDESEDDNDNDTGTVNNPKTNEQSNVLDGVLEKFREPRLLDKQFETFMQAFEDDDSDSEPDEDVEELRRRVESGAAKETGPDDIFAFLTDIEKQGFLDAQADLEIEEENEIEDTLLNELSGLNILETNVNDTSNFINDDEGISEEQKIERENEDNNNDDVEGYRQAEFERGMKGVLDSYVRIPASEALVGGEGIDVAKEALQRFEGEETERLERLENEGRLDENGLNDGDDSELDTLFDEEFNNPIEQWDCETIISTYSNLENHPSVIDAPCRTRKPRSSSSKQSVIRLDPRTQAPAEFVHIGATNETIGESSARKEVDFGSRATDCAEPGNSSGGRDRGESKEDKKRRKAKIKELARQRRAMKSEMKKAFGAESLKQNKHSASLGKSKVAVQF